MIEKDSAFLYIRHCVDVSDYAIRITNQSRSVYFTLFFYHFISISFQTQVKCTNLKHTKLVLCVQKKKSN